MNCATCGKPFVEGHAYSNTNHAARSYCSAPCRVAPRRAKNREERRERYRALKLAGAEAWQASYGSLSIKRFEEIRKALP